jgi:hypothetical protein
MLKDPSDECRLRNKKEAAHFLGVSVGTIERLMRRDLPYVKLSATGAVRFRQSDLTDFVDRRVRGFSAALSA